MVVKMIILGIICFLAGEFAAIMLVASCRAGKSEEERMKDSRTLWVLGRITIAMLKRWGDEHLCSVYINENPENPHEMTVTIRRGGISVARKVDDSEEMTLGGFQSVLNQMLGQLESKEIRAGRE